MLSNTSMSSRQQQPHRQAQEYHFKDPSQNNVEAGSTTSTTSTTSSSSSSTTTSSGTTTTTSTESITAAPINYEPTPRRPYPLKPSTRQAATAHSLFSTNNTDFTPESAYSKKHYLSPTLSGKLWYDINADGKRGDYGNATLNEMEYDYGLPNVGNIFLVSCDSQEKRWSSTTSRPFNARDTIPLQQSIHTQSGTYTFGELDTMPSGRYYVMYESPRGFRVSANTLPLGRREGIKDGDVYYECVPEGGEGEAFYEQAKEGGDFDYGGYCGRSMGCFEIGTEEELRSKFVELEMLEETEYWRDVIQGDTDVTSEYNVGGKMVALPETYVMDVGMSMQEWPLPAKQFADAMVTLRFPVGGGSGEEDLLETLLSDVFADVKTFGSSDNRNAMSKTLYKHLADQFVAMGSGGVPKSRAQNFANGDTKRASSATGDITEAQVFADDKSEASIFALDGIDLFDAKIERKKKKHTKDNIDQIGRYLRANRRNQEEIDDEVLEVTYTFTARGTYNPPPHEQLGYFVANSINANPSGLVRSLRDDKTLPFQDIESAESSHLTVGPPPPKVCPGCIGIQAITVLNEGGLKSWATVPVILLSLMIASLTFAFFGRRLWKRRVYLEVDELRDMKTAQFKNDTMTDEDIAKEKAEQRLATNSEAVGLEDDDRSNSRKKTKKTKHKDRLEKSENSSRSNTSSNTAASLDEIDAALAKASKKHEIRLDGSNRSNTSGSTNKTSDEVEYEDEAEEERRKKRKKEKKARKKAERMSAQMEGLTHEELIVK